MADTKHSMHEALKIQKAFEAEFGHKDGLLGIGIGLNQRRDDLAINVYVVRERVAEKLPKTFNGLEVVVDVVGVVRAL